MGEASQQAIWDYDVSYVIQGHVGRSMAQPRKQTYMGGCAVAHPYYDFVGDARAEALGP